MSRRNPIPVWIGILGLFGILLIGQDCLAQCVGPEPGSCDTIGMVGAMECEAGCEVLVSCEWYQGSVGECIDECLGYSEPVKQCLCTCQTNEGCAGFVPCVDACLQQ